MAGTNRYSHDDFYYAATNQGFDFVGHFLPFGGTYSCDDSGVSYLLNFRDLFPLACVIVMFYNDVFPIRTGMCKIYVHFRVEYASYQLGTRHTFILPR